MSLGDNIRYLRISKGYSQDFLAEKLGYKSYTTIQKWESGVSEPPIKKLKEIADFFKVDMDDLANKDLSLMIDCGMDYMLLTPDESVLIEVMRKAAPAERDMLNSYLKMIANRISNDQKDK